MTESNISIAIETYGKQIPQAYMGTFRGYLQNASDSCINELMSTPIKRKGVTLALSLFLGGFGVDRFYLGDKGLGAAKLVVGIVSVILFLIPILGWIVNIGRSIWLIVDWFLTYKKAKEVNYSNLCTVLHNARAHNNPPKITATPQIKPSASSASSPMGSAQSQQALSHYAVKTILTEFSNDLHIDGTIQDLQDKVELIVPIVTFEKETELVFSVYPYTRTVTGNYRLGKINENGELPRAILNFNKSHQVFEANKSLCAIVESKDDALIISAKEVFSDANDLKAKLLDIVGNFVAISNDEMEALCNTTIISGGKN